MGEQFLDSYEEVLMHGNHVLGGLGGKRHEFPWLIYAFRPSSQFDSIRHSFDEQNRLWDELQGFEDQLDEDPDLVELEDIIDSLESELDTIEQQIEALELYIRSERTGHITPIEQIHIRDGAAEILPKLV
ncbi:MAG: hypothetical protein HY862_15685 [Chloroflexi bacterium]|nr:hypothetical protein [Chloroflexota bacterium]